MSYDISKIKVKKGFPEVFYSQEKGGVSSNYQATINGLVHQDLAEALDKLKAHLCLITELINPVLLGGPAAIREQLSKGTLHEHEAFDGFYCTGLSLSSDGVVLIGGRKLSTGKVLNITAPFTLMTDEGDYLFWIDLDNQVQAVITETELLLEGKMGVEQLELFDQDEAA